MPKKKKKSEIIIGRINAVGTSVCAVHVRNPIMSLICMYYGLLTALAYIYVYASTRESEIIYIANGWIFRRRIHARSRCIRKVVGERKWKKKILQTRAIIYRFCVDKFFCSKTLLVTDPYIKRVHARYDCSVNAGANSLKPIKDKKKKNVFSKNFNRRSSRSAGYFEVPHTNRRLAKKKRTRAGLESPRP